MAIGHRQSLYVVFGKSDTRAIDLTLFDAGPVTIGYRITSTADANNYGLDSLGDMNGDGLADLIWWASKWYETGDEFPEEFDTTWVVFGKRTPGTIDTDELGDRGITISGGFGSALSSGAGDVNGDGFDDLVGSYGCGIFHFILGASTLPQELSFHNSGFMDADLWFRRSSHCFGYSVNEVGDLNGDGRDESTIGATRLAAGLPTEDNIYRERSEDDGDVFLVEGTSTGFDTSLLTLEEKGTRYIRGRCAGCSDGGSLSGAYGIGDVNHDGTDDLLFVTAAFSRAPRRAYLVLSN
jgi:hypothetical protein